MRHLNDVSLAGRWWPVLVSGRGFIRDTGTDHLPHFVKKVYLKINVKALDLDSPEETYCIRASLLQ